MGLDLVKFTTEKRAKKEKKGTQKKRSKVSIIIIIGGIGIGMVVLVAL